MTSDRDVPGERKLVGHADGKHAHEEMRRDALGAYLETRVAEGFIVESRTGTQAIIAPPRRALSRFRRADPAERLIVVVDEHGTVSTSEASPRRS